MGCTESSSYAITPQKPHHSLLRSTSLLTDFKQNSQKTEVPQNARFTTDMLKHILNKPIINSPGVQQFQKMYVESDSNIKKFFQKTQQRISDLYISLSKQTLQLMGDKRLSNIQGKIYISEEILYTSMNILKAIGIRTNFKNDSDIIHKLNSLQLSMISYMKAKYPRSGQSFVPGQLMQQFKNFDMTEQPENDILKAMKIHFGNEDEKKITLQVKKFINKIIQQIDSKSSIFQNLLSQQVFVVEKQGKKYTVNNKIGRKIPQNVQKFVQQQDTPIQLKSPQIFRVIVKWVNDMQDYILHPQEQIKQKDNYKTYTKSGQDQIFDSISSDQLQQHLQTFQDHLTEEKKEYQKQLEQLKNYIELFNHNLLRVLTRAQRKQKYVPRKEAQVIKYSMYNTKLLSWMLIQKLKIVLKKLIRTSLRLKESIGIQLDLIKFNVTDLLRSMMIGNKFQIIRVFQNLKSLQIQNKIRIIRIKNRLQTPLNDVMIIFRMFDSFLICQLQLILSDGNQSASDKLKNIQMLNHFFYELDRSPYGVMAQVSALLGFKDNKTTFQQKLTFQKIVQNNLNKCAQVHPKQILTLSAQKKPFICSQCTTYYGENQNQFIYKTCKQCNLYLCVRCIMSQQNQDPKKLYLDTITKKISGILLKTTEQQNLYIRIYEVSNRDALKMAQFADSQTVRQQLLRYFYVQNIKPLRQITNKKNVVTFKQIQKYVQSLQQKKQKGSVVYITIGKFINGQLQFFALKWDKLNGVNYCFNFGQDNLIKQIYFRYYDFIIVNSSKQTILTSFAKQFPEEASVKMFKNYNIPNIERSKIQIKYISLVKPQFIKVCQVYLTVDAQINDSKNDGQNKNENRYKRTFKYESIDIMRKNLPDLLQTQQVYNMANQGIETVHLDYFKRIQWKQNVKFINLHDNIIDNVDVILANLVNLQKLMISKNCIKNINFSINLPKLKKLIAFHNQISEIKGLDKIPNIVNINLHANHLKQFDIQKIKFSQLRVLQLHQNSIGQFNKVKLQNCPKLTTVTLQGQEHNEYKQNNVEAKFNLPYLLSLDLRTFAIKSIQLQNNSNLQFINFQDFYCENFTISQPKSLKKIKIARSSSPGALYGDGNLLNSNVLTTLLDKQFPQLLELQVSQSWKISALPILKVPKLKRLIFYYTHIADVSNLVQSNFGSLQYLQLSYTFISKVPDLQCPNLKQLKIQQDSLNNIQNITNWEVPQLKKLELSRLTAQVDIPSLNKHKLKQCIIRGGKFKQNSNFSSETIQTLSLKEIDCQHIPKLILPNTIKLQLQSCNNVNLKSLQQSSMQKLKKITGRYLTIQQNNQSLPILNFPSLQQLDFSGCQISNIDNLSLSKLMNLKVLDLKNNIIKKIPILNLPNIIQLNFNQCSTEDATNLQLSNLSSLTVFNFSYNKIVKFPKLNCPKLQILQMVASQITQINNITLSNLQSLQSLNLSGNTIPIFQQVNLPKLHTLVMDFSQLTDIQQMSTSIFNQLKQLNLSYVNLTTPILPILKIEKLKTLNISNSNIQDINNLTLSDLPSMTQLTISTSKVKILPVLKFKLLQTIKANSTVQRKSTNALQSVQNLQYSDLPQLQTLQLQQNNLTSLPKMNFKKLKMLYLTGNSITDLTQFNKSLLPNFQLINIYQNKINLLPGGKNVKPLSIYMKQAQATNFNQFVQVAPFVTNFFYNSSKMPQRWPDLQFRQVKIFQLQQNQIQNADQIMKNQFPQATEITFADNKLVKAPCVKGPKLNKLYLNRNCIKDMKDFVRSNLPNINMISFQSNQIQDLIDFPFTNVNQVYLSHNKFSDISCFAKYKYPNLKLLVLFDIKIKKVCKFDMPNLQSFWINSNQIQSIADIKGSNLPKMNMISFENNKITDISPLNTIINQNLQKLYFKTNKIKKLCQLNFKKLQLLSLSQNPLQNVDQFVKTKLEYLYTLYFSTKNDDIIRSKIYEQLQKVYAYGTYFQPLIQEQDQ